MTTSRVHIWYDDKGDILAVGQVPTRIPAHDPSALGIYRMVSPVALPNQRVVELSLPAADLERLHETHCIDPQKGALVPKGRQAP